MMDCNFCKKTIPEDSEFCPFCGSKIVHKTEEFSESGESLHQYQTEALLKRAFLFLEDGLFEKADVYVEEVLNRAPENAEAYIVKLMIELRVKTREELENLTEPFDTSKNYQKALRFADDKLKATLTGYIEHIHIQSENARLENIYLEATNAMNNAVNEETYKQAAAIFRRIPEYKDSAACLSTCLERAENMRKDTIYSYAILNCRRATQLYELKHAMEKFQSISEWKDSKEQILLCQRKIEEMKQQEERQARTEKKVTIVSLFVLSIVIVFCFLLFCVIIPNSHYKEALALMDEGQYNSAIAVFEILDGYKDSASKIEECKGAIYTDAIAKIDEGNVVEAYEALIALDDYKNSAEKAISIYDSYKNQKLKLAKVGDCVFFGTYEQDNIILNGQEAIEWKVLAKNGTRILVISKYILEQQQYHMEYDAVTWETCSLRNWINNEFINTAFSVEEKEMIATTTVSADKNPDYKTNPGNETQDKVFLLSIVEANTYFHSNAERSCEPTAYAMAKGISRYDGNWWLRTPGENLAYATSVDPYDGYIYKSGRIVYLCEFGIRPAMWIDLEA